MLLKKRQQKQMSNRLRKNNKGVTLVEVIAVIAVMSVVMAAVTGFMITGVKMSAQVSDGATAGMREQTAVEFIQKTVLQYGQASLKEYKIIEDDDDINTYSGLLITLSTDSASNLDTCALITSSENGYVVYQLVTKATNSEELSFDEQKKPLELCPCEEFYFYQIENNTVTYVLNGEEHVVHLRVAS